MLFNSIHLPQPRNKTNLSATIKVNCDVRGLYSTMDQVSVDNGAEFFDIDLDKRLEKNVPSKEGWVDRF